MKITVTQEDLDSGLAKSFTHDPICKAIRRAIQKKYKIDFNFQVLICSRDYVFIDGRIVELPEQASNLIALFDNRKQTRPITFEIEDLSDDFFATDRPKR